MKFINKTIIPFFLSKRRGNDKRNEVSTEKMTSLWLQRRKKAISVIGNNSYWPNIENVLISVQRNEDYYAQSSKCADSNGFEGVVPPFFDREEALAIWYYGHFFETFRKFDIPFHCCLVEVLYCYSSFSVICGFELSKELNIIRGTKTGDPLSALLFILVIDRVCNPMVRETVIRQGIEDERRINPCPLQAFADDVVVVSYDVTIMNEIFDIGQVAMKIAGLEGKPSKCAVMYTKRSGNNWYKGKVDKKPTVSI